MKKALKQLLNALDKLADGDHDEVRDTDVREHMADVIHHTLVDPDPDYKVPEYFAMLSPEGNAAVKAVLMKFIAHPEFAETKALATPKERLDAFQDGDIESSEGSFFDDYFGHDDSFDE